MLSLPIGEAHVLRRHSACLVDCICASVVGKEAQRVTLSWPFLAHPSCKEELQRSLEDLSLHTALWDLVAAFMKVAHSADFASKLRVQRMLHKAGVQDSHGISYWFKHCGSDRSALHLLREQDAGDPLDYGKCYLGGCPRVAWCFELVAVVKNLHVAAALLLLPSLLTDGRVHIR